MLGLVVWERLSTDDIARVVGCSRNMVRVRVHRARRRFAKALEKNGIHVQPIASERHVQAGRANPRPDLEEA